jgi:hypothetical protein
MSTISVIEKKRIYTVKGRTKSRSFVKMQKKIIRGHK